MRLVELIVPATEADLASDRLWAAGASALEERQLGERIEFRTVLASDDEVSRDRLGGIPSTWDLRFVDAAQTPSEAWRGFASPVEIDDELVLRPAWLADDTTPDDQRTYVDIEPAGSFGLGDHPTTRLSAAAVWRSVRPGDRLLDVGCGSGVLSIVGVLRGAAHAVAVDIAEAAREATSENSMRNGVADRIDVSCTPLSEVDGHFDVVVANILAPTLVALAADLRRVLKPTGRLVISGVLADRHGHVVDALAPLRVARVDELDGWASVELAAR